MQLIFDKKIQGLCLCLPCKFQFLFLKFLFIYFSRGFLIYCLDEFVLLVIPRCRFLSTRCAGSYGLGIRLYHYIKIPQSWVTSMAMSHSDTELVAQRNDRFVSEIYQSVTLQESYSLVKI